MKSKNVAGRIFITLGAVLIIGALSLVLYNLNQERKSEKAVNEVYSKLEKKIPKLTDDEINDLNAFSEPEGSDIDIIEDEALELDGDTFIGMLSIPVLDKDLPVIKDWSYPNINMAPARSSGSIMGRDIIIATHNYNCFFGTMNNLQSGDEVIFTAISGRKYHYEISYFQLVNGWDVGSLLAENDDDWDLTIFTCNWSGYSRIVIRCTLI